MGMEQWWIGDLATPSMGTVLDLGAQHPSRVGLVGLRLWFTDDVVTRAELQPGYLHRAAEKLFEVRDYRQVLMLADRHDWQSAFNGELLVALACEQLMGLQPPERAVWLRMLLAEFSRVSSHLGYLSHLPHRFEDAALAAQVRAVREEARGLMLALSGNRLHPMMTRLGGLACDASDIWLDDLERWLEQVAAIDWSCLGELPQNLGIITLELCDDFGLSGPVARSMGLARDLRRFPGYLAYGELTPHLRPLKIQQRSASHQRFAQWVSELEESHRLIGACIAHLRTLRGPVNVKLSKIIKLPDDETWTQIEAPNGIAGVHLVSRGQTTPWRLALRTPGFAQANALEQVLVGTPRAEVALVVASLGWAIGDLDK